jgi:hypothetical protein
MAELVANGPAGGRCRGGEVGAVDHAVEVLVLGSQVVTELVHPDIFAVPVGT